MKNSTSESLCLSLFLYLSLSLFHSLSLSLSHLAFVFGANKTSTSSSHSLLSVSTQKKITKLKRKSDEIILSSSRPRRRDQGLLLSLLLGLGVPSEGKCPLDSALDRSLHAAVFALLKINGVLAHKQTAKRLSADCNELMS